MMFSLFSVATIQNPTAEEYSMHEHKISCELSDVPEQFKVDWTTSTKATNLGILVFDQGDQDGTTQTSVLTLSSAQLVELKGVKADHILTCAIAVGKGEVKTPVTATQTLTIFTPGGL